MGIVEIIVILAVALIVIPPENLPDVMRATGKVLRELRLASNMVVRELGGALDQPADNRPPINTMKPAVTASGTNPAPSTTPLDLTASPAGPPAAASAGVATAAAPTAASAPTSAETFPAASAAAPPTDASASTGRSSDTIATEPPAAETPTTPDAPKAAG